MQVPSTSMEAYKMVHPDMKAGHHAKIMSAMRLLGIPCSMEEIAEKSGMDLAQVSRRVVELERDTIVFKNGKGRTSKGRPCFLYQLVRQTKGGQQQLF
jgi:predicted transcriptional regulator